MTIAGPKDAVTVLADVGGAFGPLRNRAEGRVTRPGPLPVVAAAGATFAPNSYARARLLRQLHACRSSDHPDAVARPVVNGVAR